MDAQKPLVSVIIPCYNAARFLPEAVASIRAQRCEPIPRAVNRALWEILLIDDGSTDHTAEVAPTLGEGVRYVRQTNAGPAAARNRGIALAHGEFIAFLDADDLWPADKLSTQLARMAQDPALEVVLGRVQYSSLDGTPLPDIRYENPDHTLVHVHLGSGLFRRRVFVRIGLFNEALKFSEDHDWFLRAREQGVRITILEPVTLHYRLHGKNMTLAGAPGNYNLTRVLKASLDRRRAMAQGQAQPVPRFADFDEANRTLVSCVVPAFNAEKYLGEAIRSILDQTYPRTEIIVIDDGSTDRTAQVAAQFGTRIICLSQPNQGAAAARNRGAEIARGACVAFLDADDLWMPDKLARQTDVLQKEPSLDMVFGQAEQFISSELAAEQREKLLGHGVIMPGVVAGAMLIRRASLLRAGPFPAQWRVGEFIAWYSRSIELGLRGKMLPGVVMRRRLHASNLGRTERAGQGDYVRILKAALDRRRAKGQA